jgi:hypothetical protein
MKYYKIIFSDYSETIGKQTSKAAMLKDAKAYCRAWDLTETIKEIIEISETEYNSKLN